MVLVKWLCVLPYSSKFAFEKSNQTDLPFAFAAYNILGCMIVKAFVGFGHKTSNMLSSSHTEFKT